MSNLLQNYSTRINYVPVIYLVAILGIYSPFYIDSFVNITFRRVAFVLAISLLLIHVYSSGSVLLLPGEVSTILLFILLLSSIGWAYDPIASLNRVFDISFIAVFYTLVVSSGRNKICDWWKILVIFSFLSTIFSTVYIAGIYTFDGVVNENTIGRFALGSLPILFVNIISHSDIKRVTLSTIFMLLNIAIILRSNSRSTFIGLLCISVLLLIVYYRISNIQVNQRRIHQYMLTGLFLFSILLFVYLVSSTFSGDIPLSLDEINRNTLGDDRYVMYVLSLDILYDHPISGIGYGSFPSFMAENHRKGFIVHNVFLRVWVGGGILAIILLIYSITASLRGYITNTLYLNLASTEGLRTAALGISITGFVIIGMFNPVFQNPLFILLLALGTGTLKSKNKHD